jgi:hypothetical protein
VLRKLGVDLEIVAVALEIAVWAAISDLPRMKRARGPIIPCSKTDPLVTSLLPF